jgi:hypothetical protein
MTVSTTYKGQKPQNPLHQKAQRRKLRKSKQTKGEEYNENLPIVRRT